MSYVTSTALAFQAFFEHFAKAVGYIVHTPSITIPDSNDPPLKAFARGVREEDLFAEAQQRDIVAVIDAAKFKAITGQDTPRRLDRMVILGERYSVETWRGAPVTEPTFFKLLLRGGQQ
jgi:hypothetical protein